MWVDRYQSAPPHPDSEEEYGGEELDKEGCEEEEGWDGKEYGGEEFN